MDTTSLIIRMAGALALILGLMFLIVFFLKKWGAITSRSSAGYIQVVENRPLLPRRHVSLIKVAGSYFLIGSTERGMSLLGRMEKKDMERFDRLIQEHRGKGVDAGREDQ
jgi:flagellar biosynthetic protein FliO